ncbi:transmembrane amino acid transporter protein-domain-containing protein [Lentinula raphanica]|nr:transmembrane amino acid transporter protein-domain-containing protein [Lentinula raphanica]
MLSEPLAFAYAGWIAGTILIILYGLISCYTAKLLAHIILADPRLRSYADVGRKAFGARSTVVISIMFCLELFAVSVILVTLYADSLHVIIPKYTSDTYKLWGLLLLIPMVFLPLSLLSYTSILGIISTIMMVVVILYDGLSKPDSPGSLRTPAETSFTISSWANLGIAYGLFMAGFSGHAVIPSLARDMVNPEEFDTMINWAFLVATTIYALIGYVGYLMFGPNVSDEISMDLLKTPGYNPIMNQAVLWMLVVSPLSKFALTTQPLNAVLEVLIGLESPAASPEDMAIKMSSPVPWSFKALLGRMQRIIVTVASVAVSVAVPEFSALMAFLGSFSAFIICIIGPVAAKVAIERKCNVLDGLILGLGIVMACWGTVAAFLIA